MNYFREKRLALWAIVVLVVLNLCTLLALLLMRPHRPPEKRPAPPDKFVPEFLARELGLKPDQLKSIESLEREHFTKARPLLDSLHVMKKRLFSEGFAEDSGQRAADSLLVRISLTETLLNKLTLAHIRDLKKVCTPEQVSKLSRLYIDMAGRAAPAPPPPDEPPPPPPVPEHPAPPTPDPGH